MKKLLFILPAVFLLITGCGAKNNKANQPAQPAVQPETVQPAAVPSGLLPASVASAVQVSTKPANGDTNPYGVAFVPDGFPAGGKLNPGDVLVANFGNRKNLTGAGSTIVKISPAGKQTVFFQGKASLGLTTALLVLKNGFVLAGSMPSDTGSCLNVKQGSLLVLDRQGKLLTTLTDKVLLHSPWGMTANDNGDSVQLFVANVLLGTITRFDMTFSATGLSSYTGTTVAAGYLHMCEPAAFAIGPSGMVYDAKTDTLYVASTADNAIYSLGGAGKITDNQNMGQVVYKDEQHLHGPFGLAQAQNGNLFATNVDIINYDANQLSEIVEFGTAGQFVKQISVGNFQGALFGLDIQVASSTARVATVNGATAKAMIWTLPLAQ